MVQVGYRKARCRVAKRGAEKKLEKSSKRGLTNEKECDRIAKLSSRQTHSNSFRPDCEWFERKVGKPVAEWQKEAPKRNSKKVQKEG